MSVQKTLASTLNVTISQMVKIQRLKFYVVFVTAIRSKILRLEVHKSSKNFTRTSISTRWYKIAVFGFGGSKIAWSFRG